MTRERCLLFLPAAHVHPLITDLWVACDKEDENEESLECIANCEHVLKGYSSILNCQISKYPSHTYIGEMKFVAKIFLSITSTTYAKIIIKKEKRNRFFT